MKALPVLALAALSVAPCLAASYTIIDLGAIGTAEPGTFAFAMNSMGQVAGSSGHPFLWSSGTLTDLSPALPSSPLAPSPARAINDSGLVVGTFDATVTVSTSLYSVTGNAMPHPFKWRNGTFTDLAPAATAPQQGIAVNRFGDIAIFSTPSYVLKADGSHVELPGLVAGTSMNPADLDDGGEVVGSAVTADGHEHAVLFANGTLQDLDVLPGDSNSSAKGINGSGIVVGDSYGPETASPAHAVLWRGVSITPLPARAAGESCVAMRVNGKEQVVGYVGYDRNGAFYDNPGAETAALLWENNGVTDLQSLLPANSGWSLAAAMDINDAGQIVGYGVYNGVYRAFLMTPIAAPPLAGDADGDGAITVADAVLIEEISLGQISVANTALLDVAPAPSTDSRGYGDGVVDLEDAVRVLRKANGLESRWP